MNLWEKGIFFLTIGLTAAVLLRLWAGDLIRVYRLLFFYLTSDFLLSLVGLRIPYNTNLYGQFYFAAQTVKILIASFLLAEIYSLALENTPALARYGRNAVGYILGAAAAIPCMVVLVDSSGPGKTYNFRRLYFMFEQTMDGTISIFLIIISVFMAWFPVRLRRNVVVYISGFIVWSMTRSAAMFAANRFPGDRTAVAAISAVQMCAAVGCLIFWLLGLRREGESRTAVVGHLWNRAEAERLTDQLNAINRGLERLRRK